MQSDLLAAANYQMARGAGLRAKSTAKCEAGFNLSLSCPTVRLSPCPSPSPSSPLHPFHNCHDMNRSDRKVLSERNQRTRLVLLTIPICAPKRLNCPIALCPTACHVATCSARPGLLVSRKRIPMSLPIGRDPGLMFAKRQTGGSGEMRMSGGPVHDTGRSVSAAHRKQNPVRMESPAAH